MLAVFGGSTGAGKSTLVNSVLGEVVACLPQFARQPAVRFFFTIPATPLVCTDQRIFPIWHA